MTSVAHNLRPILPARGSAIVKSVSSGDTVSLLGRPATPSGKAPEVIFTFERVSSPRMASKGNNNVDEPGAFPSREWLRNLVIGKSVNFETRKQGATAGDRVYGILYFPNPNNPSETWNLAVEAVRRGFAVPKVYGSPDDVAGESNGDMDDATGEEYDRQLQLAFQQAKNDGVGVHGTSPAPLVRNIRNAVDDFLPTDLVRLAMSKKQNIKVILEYIFDGSRYRCHVIDSDPVFALYQYSNVTVILAGVNAPRVGNPRADPPVESEPFAEVARAFVEQRLLQRELYLTLHGTDKTGSCIVATVHHPKGSIAVEMLKRGYGKISDWTVRMMDSLDLPALRVAENSAKVSLVELISCGVLADMARKSLPSPWKYCTKPLLFYNFSFSILQRTNAGVWQSYKPPELSTASSLTGQVVEVLTGDTVAILPNGVDYDDETKIVKISLASVRAPRIGNEKLGKPDEPYAIECKDRLRQLTVGKSAKVEVHYERDIPLATGTEKLAFGTLSVGKRNDIGELLVSEGLATTQRHREDEEKSPNYDALCLAEASAKETKKHIHASEEYKKPTTNDLTDPKKAKAYSGSLMRAGNMKAVVEYVFSGSRFKVYIPSENCHVAFACEYIRCPQHTQPTAVVGARGAQQKNAEPFGDAAKRFARLILHQRAVEINARGVTMGGVITGQLFVGQGAQRKDYTLEILGAGLATLDERKVEYGEVPNVLVDAQAAAQKNKVGVWSMEPEDDGAKKVVPKTKFTEHVLSVRLSEIRNGSNVFFTRVGDEAISVLEESMKVFTSTHGTKGAPCDVKPGKIVAALFDDGRGNSWYRAKILARKDKSRVSVLFVDHGNVAAVPVATHLRPLDAELSITRIPAVAKEAALALIHVRQLDDDDGLNAARMLQSTAWGSDLTAVVHCEVEGKAVVTLYNKEAYGNEDARSINVELVAAGYARAAKKDEMNSLSAAMGNNSNLDKLAADLAVAQDEARKMRAGMWRYGDIGDEDEEEY